MEQALAEVDPSLPRGMFSGLGRRGMKPGAVVNVGLVATQGGLVRQPDGVFVGVE